MKILLALWMVFFARSTQDAPKDGLSEADRAEFRRLVANLEAEVPAERDAAAKNLERFGRGALTSFKEALKTAKSAEARAALVDIIDKLSDLKLEDIFTRVRRIASAEEWSKPGWTDPGLERLFDRLAARVLPQAVPFTLPVKLRDVQPVQPEDLKPVPAVKGRLLVAKTSELDLISVRNCVVLVDGCARFIFAEECIIVATEAVYISDGNSNLVLAGSFIGVGKDGKDPKKRGNDDLFSVLLSGSVLSIDTALGTAHAARDHLHYKLAVTTYELNKTKQGLSQRFSYPNADSPGIVLPPSSGSENSLSSKLEITSIFPEDERPLPVLFKLANGSGEYVVRPGNELKDPSGNRIQGLEGWKLLFASSEYALFSKEDQRAAFCKDGKSFIAVPK